MQDETRLDELTQKVLNGSARSVARAMRIVDDRDPRFLPLLKRLYPHTGRAYVLGVTGTPGAGKSTLVDRLIEEYRKQDCKVGVVAVDPTSPFSGGALLGDRIRMQRHFTDEQVFIRSLATRGHMGGLSRSAGDVIRVMDAAGFDVVIVETVGVGQDELEIARLAHTTVVVMAPGMGDDVQAIKAGILEVADVFAVNKADRDGVDATVRDLEQMIALGNDMQQSSSGSMGHGAFAAADKQRREQGPDEGEGWTPPIVRTVAARGQGLDELQQACGRHKRFLFDTEQGRRIRARRLEGEFYGILREALVTEVEHAHAEAIRDAARRVTRGELDPYGAAEALIRSALSQGDPSPE